jgi:hypothetical protein
LVVDDVRVHIDWLAVGSNHRGWGAQLDYVVGRVSGAWLLGRAIADLGDCTVRSCRRCGATGRGMQVQPPLGLVPRTAALGPWRAG